MCGIKLRENFVHTIFRLSNFTQPTLTGYSRLQHIILNLTGYRRIQHIIFDTYLKKYVNLL